MQNVYYKCNRICKTTILLQLMQMLNPINSKSIYKKGQTGNMIKHWFLKNKIYIVLLVLACGLIWFPFIPFYQLNSEPVN